MISETHFTNRTFFKVQGYNLFATNHPDNRAHGGSAILMKSNIKYECVDGIQTNSIQATCVKIFCDNAPTIISAIYCPPRFRLIAADFRNYFQNLGTKFIAGGDYNAKHPWWGSRLINPKGELSMNVSTGTNTPYCPQENQHTGQQTAEKFQTSSTSQFTLGFLVIS